MTEYIKREDAIHNLLSPSITTDAVTVVNIASALSHISVADVRENVHGHWEEVEVEFADHIDQYPNLVTMRCGKCNRYHTTLFFYGNPTELMNFCPVCGAIMDGGDEK